MIDSLANNPNICLMKQDKGRGVVIVNKPRYVEKCEGMLSSDKFKTVDLDPTAKLEGQVQRALRKIKPHLSESDYKKLYPTGSKPGQFYCTAKVHKVNPGNTDFTSLPFRPIESNIGTATYNTSKFLAEMLKPLTKSEYTVESSKDFIGKLRHKRIPRGYSMVSFDVTSLFTNVPLNFTIEKALDRIYKDNAITTTIPRPDLKKTFISVY